MVTSSSTQAARQGRLANSCGSRTMRASGRVRTTSDSVLGQPFLNLPVTHLSGEFPQSLLAVLGKEVNSHSLNLTRIYFFIGSQLNLTL